MDLLAIGLGLIVVVLGIFALRQQQQTQALTANLTEARQRLAETNAKVGSVQKNYDLLTDALNIIPKPVMIAHANGELAFINSMAVDLLKSRSHEISNLVGQEISPILGSNIRALVQIKEKQVSITGIDFKIEHSEDAIACVAVLQDVTGKAQMGNNILTALKSMRNGNLSGARVDTSQLTGHHLELAKQVNEVLGCLHSLIQNTGNFLALQASAKLDEAPQVSYKGELGYLQYAQNLSLNNTASFVTEVNTKAIRISHNMHEVNSGIQNVSDRVQEQAAAVAEIATATQNISSRSSDLDEQMQRMTKDADAASHQLTDAGEAVGKAGNAMSAIQEKSRKIEEIVSLIDGIAFQTNLLALNAAVEAARAGEHGRGFAVVAGEVRALAGKSADAAKNIKHLIDETITDIRQGGHVFATASASIEKMTHSVAGLTSAIGGMRIGVSETTKGVQEINKGIELMDDSLQQIAALVEESASASEQANTTATALENAAGMFSTGLMTQMLASARQADDFRFAAGRRMIRLWTLGVESYLLNLDSTNSIDQDPLTQWRQTVPESNVSSIDAALQQLIAVAKKLTTMKGNAALFDEISKLHDATKLVTDAITAEEVRVLSGAAGRMHTKPSATNRATPKPASSRIACATTAYTW